MTEDPSIYQKEIKKLKKYTSQISKTVIPNSVVSSQYNHIKKFVRALEAQVGLFIIVLFSLAINLSIANANSDHIHTAGNLAGLTPEVVADTSQSINKFIPLVKADYNHILYAMATTADNEFINTPDAFSTNLTPPDPDPTPAVPQQRTATVDCIVQPGDTLSTIAQRYGLNIDTIKYSNNIANSDRLVVGEALKIPTKNLSSTALAKLKSKNQTLAMAERSTLTRSAADAKSNGFIVPIAHKGISQGITSKHRGIDYMASVGTPIKATAAGKVIEAAGFGWNWGYGKTIVIQHPSGHKSRYAHLSKINVSIGDYVAQGEYIGASGNTGNSTGPHLHFELFTPSGRLIAP